MEFTLSLANDSNGINMSTNVGDIIHFEFLDAPFDLGRTETKMASSMLCKEGVRCVAFHVDGKVILSFSQEFTTPCSVRIKVKGGKLGQFKGAQGDIQAKSAYGLTLFDGTGDSLDTENLVLTMKGPEMRLELYPNVESLGFAMLTHEGSLHIQAGKRPPEFSIGVFDDEDFTCPRPLRLGVPIISTIPVFYSNSTSVAEDDKYYYAQGVGPSERTMYFRVVCHAEIDSSLPANLKIWLPLGLDTVDEPVSTPLTRLGVSNGQTIYKGSYRFHKEDSINFTDGFVYLSVCIPMTVQVGLPLLLNIGAGAGGGSGVGTLETESAVAFSVIDELQEAEIPATKSTKRQRKKKSDAN